VSSYYIIVLLIVKCEHGDQYTKCT